MSLSSGSNSASKVSFRLIMECEMKGLNHTPAQAGGNMKKPNPADPFYGTKMMEFRAAAYEAKSPDETIGQGRELSLLRRFCWTPDLAQCPGCATLYITWGFWCSQWVSKSAKKKGCPNCGAGIAVFF